MSWETLNEWGSTRILGTFEAGLINDVRLVEIEGRQAVARLGKRPSECLQWEHELMVHLDANGLSVPNWIPARDGRFHIDGLVVMEKIDGRLPADQKDWEAIAEYLNKVHELTQGWRQRPGFLSTQDHAKSLTQSRIVDPQQIPAEFFSIFQEAWKGVADLPQSVVHGDPGGPNVHINGDTVTLLDWDEARVDVSALDLAVTPAEFANLIAEHDFIARRAFTAWDIAVCWNVAPDYSKKKMEEFISNYG